MKPDKVGCAMLPIYVGLTVPADTMFNAAFPERIEKTILVSAQSSTLDPYAYVDETPDIVCPLNFDTAKLVDLAYARADVTLKVFKRAPLQSLVEPRVYGGRQISDALGAFLRDGPFSLYGPPIARVEYKVKWVVIRRSARERFCIGATLMDLAGAKMVTIGADQVLAVPLVLDTAIVGQQLKQDFLQLVVAASAAVSSSPSAAAADDPDDYTGPTFVNSKQLRFVRAWSVDLCEAVYSIVEAECARMGFSSARRLFEHLNLAAAEPHVTQKQYNRWELDEFNGATTHDKFAMGCSEFATGAQVWTDLHEANTHTLSDRSPLPTWEMRVRTADGSTDPAPWQHLLSAIGFALAMIFRTNVITKAEDFCVTVPVTKANKGGPAGSADAAAAGPKAAVSEVHPLMQRYASVVDELCAFAGWSRYVVGPLIEALLSTNPTLDQMKPPPPARRESNNNNNNNCCKNCGESSPKCDEVTFCIGNRLERMFAKWTEAAPQSSRAVHGRPACLVEVASAYTIYPWDSHGPSFINVLKQVPFMSLDASIKDLHREKSMQLNDGHRKYVRSLASFRQTFERLGKGPVADTCAHTDAVKGAMAAVRETTQQFYGLFAAIDDTTSALSGSTAVNEPRRYRCVKPLEPQLAARSLLLHVISTTFTIATTRWALFACAAFTPKALTKYEDIFVCRKVEAGKYVYAVRAPQNRPVVHISGVYPTETKNESLYNVISQSLESGLLAYRPETNLNAKLPIYSNFKDKPQQNGSVREQLAVELMLSKLHVVDEFRGNPGALGAIQAELRRVVLANEDIRFVVSQFVELYGPAAVTNNYGLMEVIFGYFVTVRRAGIESGAAYAFLSSTTGLARELQTPVFVLMFDLLRDALTRWLYNHHFPDLFPVDCMGVRKKPIVMIARTSVAMTSRAAWPLQRYTAGAVLRSAKQIAVLDLGHDGDRFAHSLLLIGAKIMGIEGRGKSIQLATTIEFAGSSYSAEIQSAGLSALMTPQYMSTCIMHYGGLFDGLGQHGREDTNWEVKDASAATSDDTDQTLLTRLICVFFQTTSVSTVPADELEACLSEPSVIIGVIKTITGEPYRLVWPFVNEMVTALGRPPLTEVEFGDAYPTIVEAAAQARIAAEARQSALDALFSIDSGGGNNPSVVSVPGSRKRRLSDDTPDDPVPLLAPPLAVYP